MLCGARGHVRACVCVRGFAPQVAQSSVMDDIEEWLCTDVVRIISVDFCFSFSPVCNTFSISPYLPLFGIIFTKPSQLTWFSPDLSFNTLIKSGVLSVSHSLIGTKWISGQLINMHGGWFFRNGLLFLFAIV